MPAPRPFRNLDALLALGTTPERAAGLVSDHDPEHDWRDAFRRAPWTTEKMRARLDGLDPLAEDRAYAEGVRAVWADAYPETLVETDGSPPGLFVRGDVSALGAPTIGIVGTRHASAYGRACALKFAEAFARAGVVVVSGGAVGVDAAAHEGSLRAGGRTIACVATGLDRTYPSVNAPLFERIAASGALVSMFAFGTAPLGPHFLIRNGLVAALSRGLLVIEAPLRSGSLNTAHTAAELGRDVFVVPGTIERPGFEGSHALLREGATIVTHPDHVLEGLGIESAPARAEPPAAGLAARILASLGADALPIERIVEATGLPASDVLAEMTMLELDGRVVRGGGGYALRL